MTITNPEKECKRTPVRFSKVSKITNVETADDRNGIILDNPEEFAKALIIYNSDSVRGARATQNNLMDAIGNQGSGMGAAILLSFTRTMNIDGFTKKLAQKALSELQSSGRFHRDFDCDAMGTNFFKTTVNGTKVGDKYVLELSAYVGSKPENKLAETLGRPMALVSSIAKGRLSVVDDWWFYVDLEDVFAGLPISNKQLEGLPEYIVSGGYSGKRSEITFNHEEQMFSLDIGLDANKYLGPEGGRCGSEYMEARKTKIVGGAWTTWAENGNDRIAPKAVQPAVVISVSLPGERGSRPVAVTEDQMKAVQSARDYLAGLIRTK